MTTTMLNDDKSNIEQFNQFRFYSIILSELQNSAYKLELRRQQRCVHLRSP